MFSLEVERALRASLRAHEGQIRKHEDPVPYVSHPYHVALILARLGEDDVVLQAGLLHDVVEDCPGWSLERIEREFGPEVGSIVAELTEDKTRSWEERKRAAVEQVTAMSPRALAVKAADKLHNLRTLLDELECCQEPERVWGRFKGGRDRTLAMSVELVAALEPRVDPLLARALREAVSRLAAYA